MVNGWLVLPAFNEAENIVGCLYGIQAATSETVADGLFSLTILVVDDGSSDETLLALEDCSSDFDRAPFTLQVLSLVRNFGHQAAVIAGMTQAADANADFIITMDADGEHPAALIPEMIHAWQHGAALVHTVRNSHKQLSHRKRAFSECYYRILRAISEVDIVPGMADFKLWDGSLVRQVLPYLQDCGSTRAFASWLVPSGPVLSYDQPVIAGRKSRYSYRQMLRLAFDGITRYSGLPLRLALVFGIVAFVVGVAVAAFAFAALLLGRTVPGWTSIILLVTLFGAVQSVLLGIYGEYMFRNLFKNRLPKFAVSPTRKVQAVIH